MCNYKKIKKYTKNSGRSEQERKRRSIKERRLCVKQRQRGGIKKTEGGCKKDLHSVPWRFKKITYGRERERKRQSGASGGGGGEKSREESWVTTEKTLRIGKGGEMKIQWSKKTT